MKQTVGDFAIPILASTYEWQIGSCNYAVRAPRDPYDTISQRCCLAPGRYILFCFSHYLDIGGGWKGGFVEIFGHTYCDDFVGNAAMRTIEISGKRQIDIIWICFLKFLINKNSIFLTRLIH